MAVWKNTSWIWFLVGIWPVLNSTISSLLFLLKTFRSIGFVCYVIRASFCLKKYQPGFACLAQDIWSQFFCKLTLVALVKALLYRSAPFFHFLSWLGFPNTLTFSGRNFFSSSINSGKKYQQGHRTSKNLPAELLVLTYFSFLLERVASLFVVL